MARLRVEVLYALANLQKVVVLDLPEGSTASDAVVASGLAAANSRLAIGGQVIVAGQVLHHGDRVEILRPLALDPKEARRLRARARTRKT